MITPIAFNSDYHCGKHTVGSCLALARGELPKPIALTERNAWTVGVLVAHLETRQHGETAYFPGVPTLQAFMGETP